MNIAKEFINDLLLHFCKNVDICNSRKNGLANISFFLFVFISIYSAKKIS